MIIHEGYENLNLKTPVVALGIFDGVHRGHRSLLDNLVLRAKETKGESVVITFSPHPRLVLDQNRVGFSFLATMEEKIVLLENSKIDHLIIIEFTKKFSRIKACDFIKKVLVEKIGTKEEQVISIQLNNAQNRLISWLNRCRSFIPKKEQ